MRKPFILLVAAALFRCSSPESSPLLEPGSTRQAILDGAAGAAAAEAAAEAAAALDGIAFWSSATGKCGAPILATRPDEGFGWAVSSESCANIQLGEHGYVFVGDDIQAQGAGAPILHAVQNVYAPSYNLLNEFGIVLVKFGNVTGSTPTMPFLQPGEDAELEAGMDVVLVGYASNAPNPHIPHHVRLGTTKKLLEVTPYQLLIDQEGGGACQDDLGGPVLFDDGGTLKVAGILTHVEDNCAGTAVAIRTAPLMDHYFLNYLEPGTNVPDAPCGYCRAVHEDGACKQARGACDAAPAWVTLEACLYACATVACVAQCKADSPSGIALLEALQACECEYCDYECVGAVECGGSGVPAAGGAGGAGPDPSDGGARSGGGTPGEGGSPSDDPGGGAPMSGGSTATGGSLATGGADRPGAGASSMPSAGSGGTKTAGGGGSKEDDDGCSVSRGQRPSLAAWCLALLASALLARRKREKY
jgi:hypothetical protein